MRKRRCLTAAAERQNSHMAIAIKPYTEDLIPAVRAFNQRLAAGGVP